MMLRTVGASRSAGERPAGAPRVGGKAWGITAMLVLLYVVNWADKAVYGLVAQPLQEELGLTAAEIGMVSSMFFVAFTISGFLAGVLKRVFGLRWALALLAIGWALSMLPVTLAATLGMLLGSRMALGLLEGPSSALIHTAVYSWHPEGRRGLPSALITSAASIAKIAVAPLLALAIAAWGWRSAFVILAAVGIGWTVVWLLAWREGPYGEQAATSGAQGDGASETAAAAPDGSAGFVSSPPAEGEESAAPAVAWWRIFISPTFVSGAVAVFAMYSIVTVVLTWLPSYFEQGLGFSRVQSGVMFSLPSIASIPVLLLVSAIGDQLISRGSSSRLLRGIVPAIGLLLCGIVLAALPVITEVTDNPWIPAILLSLGYGFGSSIFPLLNAGVSQIAPASQLAGTLGVFLALMATGGIVGPYLTGLVVDGAAEPGLGYGTAFQVLGVLALIGGVLALIWVNPERDKARLETALRTA